MLTSDPILWAAAACTTAPAFGRFSAVYRSKWKILPLPIIAYYFIACRVVLKTLPKTSNQVDKRMHVLYLWAK
jgi:hypothetical protein